jgi:GR25 family glycosyltransferase involved in LPS biosynthesis
MDYAGFYINLDRSRERRAAMETHLAAYGLADRYRRFPAAEGNSQGFPNTKLLDGEMGCFTSHYLLLKANHGQTTPLHVVEDDVLFSRFTAGAIDSVISGGQLTHYDIIYADAFIPTSNILYKKYKYLYDKNIQRDENGRVSRVNLSVIDMKDVGFASTASMIISPQAIDKLAGLYATELARGPEAPIDLIIRRLTEAGTLRVGCIFPFVTSLRLESVFGTTMNEQELRLTALAGTIARHAFFIDCDWDKCREYAAKYLSLPPEDAQLQILMQILGFSLDKRFQFR